MQLDHVPGHNHIKKYFNKIIGENKLPHAMLFNGPKGSGKLALALGISQIILCTNRQENKACGTCQSCVKTRKFIHPDLHFAFPVMAKKGKERDKVSSLDYLTPWRSFMEKIPFGDFEKWTHFLEAGDKTFNINVRECNEIIKNLSLQTYEGEYKIQIIWSSEHLNKEGNRLLKLIEEPTQKTIIILLSEDQDKILNTILSRCQIIQVPPFDDASVAEYLKNNTQLSENRRMEIVHLVSGNLDLAIDLSKNEEINFSEELLNWFRVSHSGHTEKILAWVEPMLKNGKAIQKAFLAYGLHFLKEYIRSLHLNNLDLLRLKSEEKNTVLKMQRIIDITKADKLVAVLNDCIYHIGRNANIRLMFLHQSFEIETVLKS